MMWKKSESEEFHPQPMPAPQVQFSSAPRNPVPQTRERAVIGPTITIEGDLTGEEDLLIEGRLQGKVDLRRNCVTIGKNGFIKADIYGKTITVEGTVEGNLYGEEQLIVRQSGTVRGNIVSPRVALEDGSNFKGSIDMSPKEKPLVAVPQEESAIGTEAI
jgi:cytoskeletal protein CcmA (bactofilin family)